VNTVKDSDELNKKLDSPIKSGNDISGSSENDAKEMSLSDLIGQSRKKKNLKISAIRRFVIIGILALFLLQFLRIKVLVGSLSGSLVIWFVKLIDIFAYLESLFASRDISTVALLSVLPIIGIYIIFGRAFCGWVCPMDFLFELVDRTKDWSKVKVKISPRIGYVIMVVFLIVSMVLGVPFFTKYLSHLTSFFMLITSGVHLALDLPADYMLTFFSGAFIFSLLALEYLFPRLWCKVLCPVGKTYGLFNKISFLKLKLVEGSCGECNLCEQVCYMDVRITPYLDQPVLRDTNCIYCGRCVEGCDTKGKIVKMSLSFKKKETDNTDIGI
jgi:ferredoxin-type protein NapH